MLGKITQKIKGMFGKNGVDDFSFDGHGVPSNLMEIIKKNYKEMEPHRIAMRKGVTQYAGGYYGNGINKNSNRSEGGDDLRHHVPINEIRKMVNIYIRRLSSGIPQVLINTEYDKLKGFSNNFQLALNRHLEEIRLADAYSDAVMNAMFAFGVLKTGLARGEEGFELDGEWHDSGKPFSESVHPNDFVIDLEARSMSQISLIGDRYQMPISWIKSIRKKKQRGLIEVLSNSDMKPEPRVSGAVEEQDTRIRKMGYVFDIYLPKENKYLLMAEGDDTPLMHHDFAGPEGGMYSVLGFDKVPGEVLSSSPVQDKLPLHNLVNELTVKLQGQAIRQKTINVGQRGEDDDAESVKITGDGGITLLNHPDSLREVKFGGPDPTNHNFTMWAQNAFDVNAGNLTSLGGLEAQTETAKQDQLIHDSASAIIDNMQRESMAFVKDAIKKHAWYLWTDPLREMPIGFAFPGAGITVPEKWTPEIREGDFLDYNFDIEPYSLMDETPKTKAAQCSQFLTQVLMPNAEALMQLGKMPNVAELVMKIAEYQGLPTSSLLIDMDPDQQGMQEEKSGMVSMPQNTHRTYERTSRPGQSKNGRMAGMMAANAGLNAQNEQASAFQKVSQ